MGLAWFRMGMRAALLAIVPLQAQVPPGGPGAPKIYPPPAGWKSYPTPAEGSSDWVHANHSDREWRVRCVQGKVAISPLTPGDMGQDTSTLSLPFSIKPRRGWIRTTAPSPPPPPPLPGTRPSPGASAEELPRPVREASGWFRSYELELGGTRVALPVSDGWIVGFDAGEWGGGLYWFSRSGRRHHQITTERPLGPVDPDNVLDLFPCSGGVLAVQGLAHMGLDLGKVEKVTRGKNGKWRADLLTLLPGAPQTSMADGEKRWIIVTTERVVQVQENGSLRTLAQCPGMAGLYPNSIVQASDGVLYIGMRHFVARLIPEGQGYRMEFLVPETLPLSDPDSTDEVSKLASRG